MWSNSYVPLWGREVFFPIPTRICDASDKVSATLEQVWRAIMCTEEMNKHGRCDLF